jgi:uncharacterized phage protein (TIGR01671 family)
MTNQTRPIKFRVYVKSIVPEETGIYYPEYISWWKNGDSHDIDKVYTDGYKFKNDTCEFKVMQHTGLNDKNNKPIFESDVVLIHPDKVEKRVVEYGMQNIDAYVGYGWNLWSGYNDEGNGYEPNDKELVRSFEVIGNVYEHPELLKGVDTHEN